MQPKNYAMSNLGVYFDRVEDSLSLTSQDIPPKYSSGPQKVSFHTSLRLIATIVLFNHELRHGAYNITSLLDLQVALDETYISNRNINEIPQK